MKKRILILLLSFILLLTACQNLTSKDEQIHAEKTDENLDEEDNQSDANQQPNTQDDKSTEAEPETEPEPSYQTIRIKAVGDLLYHTPLLAHGKNHGTDGNYDFSRQYALISDFIKDADFAVANFEGSSNPNYPADGYPMFNTPKDVFGYVKEAGFDLLSTINNHTLDTYLEGLETTIQGIEESGLDNFGSQVDPANRIKIFDIEGVHVAFLGYTDNFNGMDFLLDTPEKEAMANRLDADLIKADIAEAKQKGADAIIIYPHWGDEYTSKPRPNYVTLARQMIDWGADVVLGNHPHVTQPEEWYETEDGRQGYIIYSMGNFISNQTLETLNDIRTEQSVVVEVAITKEMHSGQTKLEDVTAHPTWMMRTVDEFGGWLHQPVIAKDYMPGGSKSEGLNQEQLNRASKAYQMVSDTLKASPIEGQ